MASGATGRVIERRVGSIFIASFVGTTIEQYDFLLYGTMAAIVFNRLFFPSLDPLIGTLAAFGTFAAGFLARPVGGILCGHVGDRVGRKPTLVGTLGVMGVATVLIGCMPTYESIGIWAPAGITLLRFVQGLAFGGEQAGAILIAVENAPAKRRGFFGSWAQTGGFAGLLLSSAVVSAVTLLPEADFDQWGWRVPFLLSIVLVLIGLFARSRVPESAVFSGSGRRISARSPPLVRLLKLHPRELAIALGARIGEIAWAFFIMTFVIAYATSEAKIPRAFVLNALLVAAAAGLVAVPCFGALSDKVGRKPLYLAGAILAALYVYPLFLILETKQPYLVGAGIVVGLGVIHPLMYGPQAAFFAELFGTTTRYSGISIGQQIAAVIGGGLTPAISTALLLAYGGNPLLVVLYIVGMLSLTIVALIYAKETFGRSIDRRDDDPDVAMLGTLHKQ
jgi:MFS transporter, MHS family, shikimate and dehydroshikimate transport protein